MPLAIRAIPQAALSLAMDWAAHEGWNPGLQDDVAFHNADPNGFLMAFDGEDPFGSISAVAYSDTFGFVGLFIVKPGYRGHDIGPQLGQAALTYLGSRNVGIDGVEKKVKNYEHYGFTMAYHNIRFEGLSRGAAPINPHVVTVAQLPSWDALCTYDRQCFPAPRSTFLKSWVSLNGATALAYIDSSQRIQGYGVIRACRQGYKVGPLFADHPDVAAALLQALESAIPQQSQIYLDVPECHSDAVRMVTARSFTSIFSTARMYNRGIPALTMNKIFGVTTFELG